MNKTLIGIVAVAAIGALAAFGTGMFDSSNPDNPDLMENGQLATHARTVQTETGGVPHHEPIQYRAKDARPAITEPEFIPGFTAQIAGGTKGIGVEIDGKSRFYPLYVLQYHQVINDTLEDCAIACSYWSSEQTLVVHERKVEGSDEPLELRVSGAVLHGNLIMFDKETNTRWLQETGNAIDGQQKGKALKELDKENWKANVRWDVWFKQHPDSELLFCSHCEHENKKQLAKGPESESSDVPEKKEEVKSEDSASE